MTEQFSAFIKATPKSNHTNITTNYLTFAHNRGVPCPDTIGTETQAEIIPVERFAYTSLRSFHAPEPDNAGVGKEQFLVFSSFVYNYPAVLRISIYS